MTYIWACTWACMTEIQHVQRPRLLCHTDFVLQEVPHIPELNVNACRPPYLLAKTSCTFDRVIFDHMTFKWPWSSVVDAPEYNGTVCDFAQADSEGEGQAEAQQAAAPAAIAAVPDLDPEAIVMMTRKQRGLYNAMQRGLSKKRQRAESLQAKAKKLKQPT